MSIHYEAALAKRGLDHSVLAYRQIKKTCGGGKCNIDFAKDAFDCISSYDECTVYAFDIASYFEDIDHQVLKAHWADLLGDKQLPPDHFKVFKAITQYAHIDREAALKALGYKVDSDLPEQLCKPSVFREKIVKQGLIQRNANTWGIPQGSPISDVLANIYLLDFDTAMHAYASSKDGVYLRYSDDILLIIPHCPDAAGVSALVTGELKKQGGKLTLSEEKTVITKFHRIGGDLNYQQVSAGKVVNGVEYLGFRFDGTKVFLRDSTVSGLYRKISRACKHYARTHIAKNPGQDFSWLKQNFDFRAIEQQFGKVQDFEPHCNKNNWTFWTYASKALSCFENDNQGIRRQLRNQKKHIRNRFEHHLRRELNG